MFSGLLNKVAPAGSGQQWGRTALWWSLAGIASPALSGHPQGLNALLGRLVVGETGQEGAQWWNRGEAGKGLREPSGDLDTPSVLSELCYPM